MTDQFSTISSGRLGAVAAGHEVTAEAALDMLRAGGNAFDAILAGLCAACVAEPVLTSLGGGGFLMAHDSGKTVLYDFFCDTPLKKRSFDEIEFEETLVDFGTTKQTFHLGAGSSATPGMIPGILEIHRERASLPLSDLVRPAELAAKSGIRTTPFQAHVAEVVAPILLWSEEGRGIFAPRGTLVKAGDITTNPGLAEALELLANGRSKAINNAMISANEIHPGQLRKEDFDRYDVAVREPLTLRAATGQGSADLWLNPPPAMGGLLAAGMFERLSGFAGGNDPSSRATAMAEVDGLWREHGSSVGKHLFPDGCGFHPRHMVQRGTTHISVVDASGRAAAATVSNGEGNGRAVPGFGFMLNNMLGEDDLNPGGLQAWEPGQRLSSMMTPTIAKTADGTIIALGSGGSNRIRTAVFQALANLLLEGMAPEQAVAASRLHYESGLLDIEGGLGTKATDQLATVFPEARIWSEKSLYFGGVHAAIALPDGTFAGAGDPRRSGVFRTA